MNKPIVVFDGREGISERALFCVSSLYFAREWLSRVHVRFIDVQVDVRLALAVAAWDLGQSFEMREEGAAAGPPLDGARLYVAVAFRSPAGTRAAEARASGVAAVVAVQHPDPARISAWDVMHEGIAYDPRRLAGHIGTILERLP